MIYIIIFHFSIQLKLLFFDSRNDTPKRILLTTTSLVLAAGVAQADVTFSGKMEAGVNRTAKTDAVAAVAGTQSTNAFSSGVLTQTAVATASTATTIAAALNAVVLETQDLAVAEAALAADGDTTDTLAERNDLQDAVNAAKAALAIAEANYAAQAGTAAVAAIEAGDMVAYSGYDMNVALSSTLDNGMVVSAAFDMGAGNIADRDDDRVMDAQGAAVALSTVTIKNGGLTYVIGQDKIDDLYDDTQNGDVSVSGAAGGVSYTLVADLDKDTKAVAASTNYTAETDTASDATYVASVYSEVAAVAEVYESTSLKLAGAAGGLDWSLTTTNKNDRGNAATKVSLGYAASDALSFTLTHDTQGKRDAINTLKASYAMDAITLTVSMADDKNHAGNTNEGGKASQNLTIAYANGPLSASFNNDESSAWWATTSYDLGNGADLFATVDHDEFAVVGLSFNF